MRVAVAMDVLVAMRRRPRDHDPEQEGCGFNVEFNRLVSGQQDSQKSHESAEFHLAPPFAL